jgi:hypothetical protein
MTSIWCFFNTTKIPFEFIWMEIFQHFCHVFVPYCKIVILHFHYHTFNIVVYDFLTKNCPKIANLDGIFETLKKIMTLEKVSLSNTWERLNNMKVWHFRIHHPN